MRGSILGLILIFCLPIFSFFNPSLTQADIRPAITRTLTYRLRDEPETLDWNRAHTLVESAVLMNVMEGLVTFDAQGGVKPALAESWTLSPDKRIYTFKLKSSARWSDGVPVKAQDFVTSWKRLLSPVFASSYAYLLFDIEGAEAFNKGNIAEFETVGIKALGDLTFQVTLSQPTAHWIFIPAFWSTFPLRADLLEKYDENWVKPGNLVTTGPYVPVTFDHGSQVVMRSNVFYHGVRGNIDLLVAKIVRDDSLAIQLFNSGALDFLSEIANVDFRAFAKNSSLVQYRHYKTGYLSFVLDRYPTSNAKLRRAIGMAIDRNKINSQIFGGSEPASSFVPPPLLGHTKKRGLPYDPARAMIELNASGINLKETLNFECLLPDWEKMRQVGAFIKNDLKKNLGIEVTLQPFENRDYRSRLEFYNSPLYLTTWTADYPDPDNFMSLFLSNSGNSRNRWKNPDFDVLVQKARHTMNPKEREPLYFQLQKLIQEDQAGIIPLFYEPNLVLIKPRVKYVEITPMDFIYFRNAIYSGY